MAMRRTGGGWFVGFIFVVLGPSTSADDQGMATAYFNLASALTDRAGFPSDPYQSPRIRAAVAKGVAEKASDPVVQRFARELSEQLNSEDGRFIGEKLRKQAEIEHKEAQVALEETIRAAARGEYIRTKTETVYDRDYKGDVVSREVERTIDEGPEMIRRARSEVAIGVEGRLARAMKPRLVEAEGVRLRFWKEGVPGLPARYAGPRTPDRLVVVRFDPDGGLRRPTPGVARPIQEELSDDGFYGRHVAVNVSSRDLHNVTLVVDLVDYVSHPKPEGRNYYFIPLWKAGTTIDLARDFRRVGVVKVENPDALDSSRQSASRAGRRPGSRPTTLELNGLMGVVRAETSVWCDEATQPATANDLPERINAVGEALLASARDAALQPGAWSPPRRIRSAPAFRELEAKIQKDLVAEGGRIVQPSKRSLVEFLAGSAAKIAPPGSDLARRAREFLANPEATRRNVKKQSLDALVEACSSDHVYTGEFFGSGAIGVRFGSARVDGSKVSAALFSLDTPEITRPLEGGISWDAGSSQYLVRLKAVENWSRRPTTEREIRATRTLDRGVKVITLALAEGVLHGQADNTINQYPPYSSPIKLTLRPEKETSKAIIAAAPADALTRRIADWRTAIEGLRLKLPDPSAQRAVLTSLDQAERSHARGLSANRPLNFIVGRLREFVRYAADPASAQEIRNLIQTLEEAAGQEPTPKTEDRPADEGAAAS